MEESSLYRKESMERIQSPEQLNDYLRITNPTIWVVLAAVILLLVGMLVWGACASIDSFAQGTALVENGQMTVLFDDENLARNVRAGMEVVVGDASAAVKSVGRSEDGALFARADTTLSDGVYEARVTYRKTQVLKLLFN